MKSENLTFYDPATMKIENIRLLQEPGKSIIVYKECNPFSHWHHHPEFELVLITKGKGKRVVGDHISRFEENDLVLVGSYTPHEWLCDPEYFDNTGGFKGEGIVVQFLYDFLGETFFEIPENYKLKKFLKGATNGYQFHGFCKSKIISIMLEMQKKADSERLFALFNLFEIFTMASQKDYKILASPLFLDQYHTNENGPMQKATKYILQNFQQQIHIQDLLNVTNMSASSFCKSFKNTYRMTFKDFLLNIRVGYACKLLIDSSQNISVAAYMSGFENLSNFNRQFKKIKNITPSEYVNEISYLDKMHNIL